MKYRSSFPAAISALIVLGTFSCSNSLRTTPAETRTHELCVEFGGLGARSARGLDGDGSVTSVAVTAIYASGGIIGGGSLTPRGDGSWGGNITVSRLDDIYLVAEGMNSDGDAIYDGSSAEIIGGSDGMSVTIAVSSQTILFRRE